MGTTLTNRQKNFLTGACKFLCGLAIGAAFSFLVQRHETTSNEETAVENDYPQV
jgi:hypothetical protein